MRIITGLLKGRKINIPKSLNVRPTTDRVKEGVFSAIDARRYIANTMVLDLFAGSGSLGFEALSRGAREVRFVDHNAQNIAFIEKLANEYEMASQVRTVTHDAPHFLEGPPISADIIFCDPPYKLRGIEEIAEQILQNDWLAPQGWLVLEHNKYHDFSDHENCFEIKKYGRTFVSFFNQPPSQ